MFPAPFNRPNNIANNGKHNTNMMDAVASVHLLKVFFFSLPTLTAIYLIYSYPHSNQETAIMCEELKKIGDLYFKEHCKLFVWKKKSVT